MAGRALRCSAFFFVLYKVMSCAYFFAVFCCLVFTVGFYLSIAGLAPLASYSFATAQKSNQKRPPQQLRPSAIAPALP